MMHGLHFLEDAYTTSSRSRTTGHGWLTLLPGTKLLPGPEFQIQLLLKKSKLYHNFLNPKGCNLTG